jgi:hypothetical protein
VTLALSRRTTIRHRTARVVGLLGGTAAEPAPLERLSRSHDMTLTNRAVADRGGDVESGGIGHTGQDFGRALSIRWPQNGHDADAAPARGAGVRNRPLTAYASRLPMRFLPWP